MCCMKYYTLRMYISIPVAFAAVTAELVATAGPVGQVELVRSRNSHAQIYEAAPNAHHFLSVLKEHKHSATDCTSKKARYTDKSHTIDRSLYKAAPETASNRERMSNGRVLQRHTWPGQVLKATSFFFYVSRRSRAFVFDFFHKKTKKNNKHVRGLSTWPGQLVL